MILNFQLSQGHENHLQDFENSVEWGDIIYIQASMSIRFLVIYL